MRIGCLLNYFIHICFIFDQEPEFALIEMMQKLIPRFEKMYKDVTLRVFYPLLKEQVARYNLLKRKKNVRKFIYSNVIAATEFAKIKEMNLIP